MVLTPAVIDSPRKPYTGWQKSHARVQTYMFSQSIGPTRYPLAPFTLPWLAKTRCVLLKSSVFTRKIIAPPRKPCPGWQKPHRRCQSHMFSQSDRPHGNPVPPHTLPSHTQNRSMLPKSCVSQSDRLLTGLWAFRKWSKSHVFEFGWVQRFMLLFVKLQQAVS